MTRDPDQRRAADAAARELARRLQPWIVGMADLDAFAREFITDMQGEDWRHIPRPPVLTAGGRADPAAYQRGAAKARELLARARARTPKET